jgi:2-polyprenyl-3-methyl-5-hydroxy-6-metoxy-1,4-benzoquinol methylase
MLENKSVASKRIKNVIRNSLESIMQISLNYAAREQGLFDLRKQLEEIVPDISDQYSTFKIMSPYLKTKVRNQHAFQISLVNQVLEEYKQPVIVDIGDSSGTHLEYIIGLHKNAKQIRCLSVNLDIEAIAKIKKKGLEAVHTSAEQVENYNINPDIFLCFETLEHLMDPCKFLHELSSKTKAKYLIVTVPYQKNSRVGLSYIRNKNRNPVYAENTHIFEFAPEDWKLLMQHSGWRPVKEKIYLQYPKKSLLKILKHIWKKMDFEGFYGIILSRDNSKPSQYKNW